MRISRNSSTALFLAHFCATTEHVTRETRRRRHCRQLANATSTSGGLSIPFQHMSCRAQGLCARARFIVSLSQIQINRFPAIFLSERPLLYLRLLPCSVSSTIADTHRKQSYTSLLPILHKRLPHTDGATDTSRHVTPTPGTSPLACWLLC